VDDGDELRGAEEVAPCGDVREGMLAFLDTTLGKNTSLEGWDAMSEGARTRGAGSRSIQKYSGISVTFPWQTLYLKCPAHALDATQWPARRCWTAKTRPLQQRPSLRSTFTTASPFARRLVASSGLLC
jgi:hypothetical protein